MLSVRNLTKIYKIKGKDAKQVVALDHVSLDFPETGMVFLLGKSGSGKSTLLNTIGGLDTFNEGEVIIKGKSSKQFKQGDFDAYRNTFIGFIFQEYNILEEFTVGKNLALALELQGKKASKDAVNNLLEQVDLTGYSRRKPNQLSGGQKQRIAIARALIKDPEIIMADEPTGALDSNTGRQVMETLKKLSKTKLVIVVSHDKEFAEIYGDRVIELKDGKIISDTTKHEVEANRSASGISFIDNKIIHIKKGQKVTKQDLVEINKLIVENANNDDTIISFDSKPNEELKKVAFITDEGNREVFKATTGEDINLKQYDPKKFKLIRSHLKVKDAFKMGTSSLKHKPIRLLFTILLSFIAFAMFGLTDTMASFNVATSTYESLKMMDVKTLVITGAEIDEERGYKYSGGLDNQSADAVKSAHSNYDFFKVVFSGYNYYLQDAETNEQSSYNPFKERVISGALPINDNVLSKLNLTLQDGGSLPTADDEIVISKHMFDCIKSYYKNISTLSDLATKKLEIHGNKFKVVGIVQDDTNVSKYENSSTNEMANLQDFINYSELQSITKYGLVNMCYVTEDVYNTLVEQNEIWREFYYYVGEKPKNSYSGISSGSFDKISEEIAEVDSENRYHYNGEIQYYSEYDTIPEGAVKETYESRYIKYKKSGYDINNLQKNDIIIGTYAISDLSDPQSLLDNGLVLTLEGRNDNILYQFNVVALSSGYSYVISDEKYSEMFSGYDYLMTRMKNTRDDESLVKSLVSANNNGMGYEIQFSATYTLNNFSNLIVNMSKVFLYVGIGFAVFASFMLMNFIATSISYKKREIGILRAVGAGKKDVFSIFFSESFVIAIINFVLATIATFVVAFFINRSLYQDLGFSITLLTVGIRQIALLLGVSVGVAFISTFLPVWKIAKKNPIDSINNR